ncbi:MAG: OstA-like protein [Flavobacteriales bacterium AspAUS03]
MNFTFFKYFIYLFLLIHFRFLQSHTPAFPIKEIHLLHADLTQKNAKIAPNAWVLKGNVQFEHQGTILSCDSSVYYKEQNLFHGYDNVKMYSENRKLYAQFIEYDGNTRISKAYGNPIAYEGTTKLTANILIYNAQTKRSQAVGKAVLIDKKTRLTTHLLEYDGNTRQAYYTTGGTIYDGENTLVSQKADYFSTEKRAEFTSKVCLTNKKQTIRSERANYYTEPKRIDFSGPTIIEKNENPKDFIYTENGSHYTQQKTSYSSAPSSSIHHNGKTLKGDRLYFDHTKGYGSATGNVWIEEPEKNRYLSGGYAEVYQNLDSVILTDRPVAIKVLKDDNLFIHTDTLTAVRQPDSTHILRAYPFAKIFKANMQGKCDSIFYKEATGIIEFHTDPVLWVQGHQLTGDTMYAYINAKKESIESVDIIGNSFIISKIDTINEVEFNQMKGRKMTGFFENNEMKKLIVTGNGQILYYADDEDEKTKKKKRIGINKSTCGIIEVYLNQHKIQRISCQQKAQSELAPESKIPKEQRFLSKFLWREKERPQKIQEIFIPDLLKYRNEQQAEQRAIEKLKKDPDKNPEDDKQQET